MKTVINNGLKHTEIITGRGYMKHVNDIVSNFINMQNNKGIEINKQHERELKKLTKLFIAEHKISKPIIINSDLGFGKSTLLVEFIKYMCEIDKEYSAIIVKKTIKECKDFVIELGLKNKNEEKYETGIDLKTGECLDRFNSLKRIYYENSVNENKFIARAVRSFNYSECKKIKRPYGNTQELQEYSPSICNNCDLKCPVRFSKWNIPKHRIIVITHQRLFLSNDNEDIINQLKYWVDEAGVKHERKIIIADEKMQTVDMGSFTLNQWNDIHTEVIKSRLAENIKNMVNDVNKYILDYSNEFPQDTNMIKAVNRAYSKNLDFIDEIYALFLDDQIKLDAINNVEKFLRYGGTLNIDWQNNYKCYNYTNYVKLEKYIKYGFNKFMILDATSEFDKDYIKSDAILINDLKKIKKFKVNIHRSLGAKATKKALYFDGNRNNTINDNRDFYQNNVFLIAKDIEDVINKEKSETLIVCYNQFKDPMGNQYHFKEDLWNTLNELDIKYEYHINHFGENTTGINNYKDCETIIIIGLLNKGSIYYTNKALLIEDKEQYNEVMFNEYTIDMIQQIGRTAIRQDKQVSVYMLDSDDAVIKNLCRYFNSDIKDWILNYYNEFTINSNNDVPWIIASGYIVNNLINKGDSIEKSIVKKFVTEKTDITTFGVDKIFVNPKFKRIINSCGIESKKFKFVKVAKNDKIDRITQTLVS